MHQSSRICEHLNALYHTIDCEKILVSERKEAEHIKDQRALNI